MAYDPSAATATDRVRFLLGDTSATAEVFTDDEYAMVLAVTGSTEAGIYAAAAEMALAVTASAARQAIALTVLGQDLVLDKRAIAREMRLLYDKFLEKAALEDPGTTARWRDGNMDHLRSALTTMRVMDYEDDTIEGA